MINQNHILYNKLKAVKQITDITHALDEYYQSNDINSQNYVVSKNIVLACLCGCNYCCNLKVKARAYELFLIAQYIIDKFAVGKREQTITKLNEHKTHLSQITSNDHISTNVPCPLLFDGVCSVYPVRPFACRAYYALDVSSCRYSFENPSDLKERRQTDPDLDSQWERIRGSVAAIFQQLGYDIAAHELGTSLLSSLQDSTNQKRWINRKKAFVGLCTYRSD